MTRHTIDNNYLDLPRLKEIIEDKVNLELSDQSREQILKCRSYLDKKMDKAEGPVYGINTGFGSLYDKTIDPKDLGRLQLNLVKSHACGAGPRIPAEIVRLMLFLKVQSLSYGYSGVQLETVERLIDMFNNEIYPVVYTYGSLGASGDLAPLAHLCLPMLGDGEVEWKGKTIHGKDLLSQMDWEPIELQSKEGLALLNGTQMMAAFGIWCQYHAYRLITLANRIAALSLDVFDGRIEPFTVKVNKIRPHHGQAEIAQIFNRLLSGSELMARDKSHVQDPYSFRCIPQVHGATLDTLGFTNEIFKNEINGVTDNPIIFPEDDEIISAGNFHGQPLALAFDYLSIALSELGNISERRTFQLISGSRGLPSYLVKNPGINSGFMIPQYTAASIVSANKQLSTPASVDSIVSSNGQEDHVSMGANAATKAYQVVKNIYTILGIELITASQALDFRHPVRTSPILEDFFNNLRQEVSFVDNDRNLHEDIIKAERFLKDYPLSFNFLSLE